MSIADGGRVLSDLASVRDQPELYGPVASDPTAADGSSSGVASVALYVDGIQEGMPVTASTTPSFLWDTTNVASGPHTLTLKTTDNAGNTGAASAGVLVSVSNGGQMTLAGVQSSSLPSGWIITA